MMQEGPARQMQEFKDFGQKESRCAAPAETAVYKIQDVQECAQEQSLPRSSGSYNKSMVKKDAISYKT